MALFSRKEPEPVTLSSLPTAFGYLLQKLDQPADLKLLTAHYSDLEPEEDPWSLITLLNAKVQITDTGEYGTWPASSNSVIRFKIQDQEQPYIEDDNGNRQANMLDHYCVVADAGDHQIIDSADGVLKNGNIYGNPVEWVTYNIGVKPEVEDDDDEPKPGSMYTVLGGGESAWNIARKLKMSPTDLIEHNADDIEDPSNIPAGTKLHLPYQQPVVKTESITYEFFSKARPMHIIKPGGARKFSFGNAKTLLDLSQSGPTYPDNENVSIFAVARVPIGDEMAAFYMDSTAVGPKGKIIFTIGFSHSDLIDGHVEKVKPEPNPQVAAVIQEAEQRQEMIEAVMAEDNPPSKRMGSDSLPDETTMSLEDLAADQLANPEKYPNLWKTTYKPLNDERESKVYLFNEDLIVEDLDGRRGPVTVFKLKGVRIAGTFEKDGVIYGRPQDAMDRFTWYGVPMEHLTAEDDLFNWNLPLAERVDIKGRLSVNERYFSVPLWRLAAKSRKVSQYLDKFKIPK